MWLRFLNRCGRAVLLLLGCCLGLLAATASPALACSQPDGEDSLEVEDLNYDEVAAIGQAEIIAQTGATLGWHKAGVVAFVEAWPVSGDTSQASTTVWGINSRRTGGGDCSFGRHAPEVGTRMGFYALFHDGGFIEIENWRVDSWESAYAAELTEQFGPPVSVEVDPGIVATKFDPMVAERRLMYWLVRVVALAALLGLAALAVARRWPFQNLPKPLFR